MKENDFQLVPANYSLAVEFSLPVRPDAQISGYAPGHPAAPKIDPNYVFMREKMRDLLAFWQSGETALKICGDPATGKTSLVEQFHARLRYPLYKVACHPRLEARDLIGQLYPTESGGLVWRDGPLLKAAREGTTVLIDEYNLIDPGEASGLNMLLEGYSVVIPETGEVVHPAASFRIIATENSVTSRLTVTGRNVQDAANDDRFMVATADYLPAELEIKVVVNALQADGVPPDVAQMIAEQVVGVANTIRTDYRTGDSVVDKPMSTRVAIRWAKLVRRFSHVSTQEGGPMAYAVRRAFQMSPELDAKVVEFIKAKLGS